MNEKSDQDLERQLSEMLTDGEMQKKDREKEERRLSPKYEIRIQTHSILLWKRRRSTARWRRKWMIAMTSIWIRQLRRISLRIQVKKLDSALRNGMFTKRDISVR